MEGSSALQPMQINVPFPDADDRHLHLRVGACRLRITPGAADPWASGVYDDPSGLLPLRVVEDGGTLTITQSTDFSTFPNRVSGPARLDLTLGTAKPFRVTLETGASESTLELGGLPITRLIARQGAGRYQIDFSAPNPVEMSELDVQAGAVGIEIRNLANANVAEMRVDGGAAAYKFDFGGTLRRAARVRVSTGASSIEIVVPSRTAARITTETMLGHVDIGDGFTKREGAFWTEAATAGGEPVLTVNASVALGALRLRTD